MNASQSDATWAATTKSRIMSLVQANDFARARSLCEELCKKQKRDAEGWFLLGAISGQQGDLKYAADCLNKAAGLRADVPAVYHNLGAVQHRLGNFIAAERAYRTLVSLNPNAPEGHVELGNALHAQRRFADAIASYRHALGLNANLPAAHFNLGNTFFEQRDIGSAEEHFRHAIRLNPNFTPAYFRLGLCAALRNDAREEVSMYQKVTELDPANIDAWNNLGLAFQKAGQRDEAVATYRKIIASHPAYAKAHINLALALQDAGQLEAAEASFNEAIRLAPDSAEAHYNLGGLLYFKNSLMKAEQAFRKAIELNPRFSQAQINLGDLLLKQGQHAEAIRCFRRALEINPDFANAHSNILFALNYLLDETPQSIWEEHRAFALRYCEPLTAQQTAHDNEPAPTRPLRIGYVSADFRMHAVAHFLEPVLEAHDRGQFQVYCYANQTIQDKVTERFRARADVWRNIYALNDAAAADLIRSDGIDILVDLSGHTHGGRMQLFARKPAPIQVTWLGYINTTGLTAIDYRIVDEVACPTGLFEPYHSEKLLRMPDHQWCYRPPADAPDVAAAPAAANGFVTFASINNTAKVTGDVLKVWLDILAAAPGSRLLLVGNGLENRQPLIEELTAARGIEPGRIEYLPEQSFANYLALHHRIDVNLDAFPYPGGTTICHSLWMGVPVVTLAGDTVASRGGASLLHVLGLDRFTAASIDAYIEIAAGLAKNPGDLAQLRSELRPRLSESPLLDAATYTRNLEGVYRGIWTDWCHSQ